MLPFILLSYVIPTSASEPGQIVSWGNGDYSPDFSLIFDTPANNDFVAIAAGADHSLALRSDGSLEAWGNDRRGQVSRTPGGRDFAAISGSYYHSVALRKDGSLVSWGNDTQGLVSNTPVGNDFLAVAAGGIVHSIALTMSSCNGLAITHRLALGELPTQGNDVIIGTPGDDFIEARNGDDTICGMGGDDTIYGQGGIDTQTNCERAPTETARLSEAAVVQPVNLISTEVLTEEELRMLNECNLTLNECLGRL